MGKWERNQRTSGKDVENPWKSCFRQKPRGFSRKQTRETEGNIWEMGENPSGSEGQRCGWLSCKSHGLSVHARSKTCWKYRVKLQNVFVCSFNAAHKDLSCRYCDFTRNKFWSNRSTGCNQQDGFTKQNMDWTKWTSKKLGDVDASIGNGAMSMWINHGNLALILLSTMVWVNTERFPDPVWRSCDI